MNSSSTVNSPNTVDMLESRYRRLLTLLPNSYRERRAEEMLGMLLDGAAEGRRWPRAVEVASLTGLAVRLRTGAVGGSLRAAAFGEVLQRFALAGLMIQTLYFASSLGEIVAASQTGMFPGWSGLGLLPILMVGCATALPAAALVCLVRGRSRTGRVLAVLSALLTCAEIGDSLASAGPLAFIFPAQLVLSMLAPLAISLVAATAALLGFHRDAPPAAAPGRWLRILAVSVPFVLACMTAAQFLDDHGRDSGMWVGAVAHVIVSPIVPAVAVMFGVSRVGRPVIWSTSLLLLSVPVMAVAIPLASLLIDHMSLQNLVLGPGLLGGSLIEVAWEAIVTQLILAIACWSAIRHDPRPPLSTPGLAGSA
jgi:hypothetical protein